MLDNPTLTPLQIDSFRSIALVRTVKKGDILYAPSQADIPFFVVISGTVVITPPEDQEKIIASRRAGQFTGEMSFISGKRSLLRASVTEDGELLEVSPEKLKALMSRDSDLGEILMEAFIARRIIMIELGAGNVVLIGTKNSSRTLQLREFLTRNGHPFTYLAADSGPPVDKLMESLGVCLSDMPVVYCNNRYVLRNPSIGELAACLDLNINTDKGVRDVLVIGAGPAGLAVAVYAASEGLQTLVVEKTAPGGQAGSSSRIENYLGFPTGLSGQELANRSIAQAIKFGAQLMVAQSVVYLDCNRRPFRVVLDSGTKISAQSIVIATGAQYARLPVEDAENFLGRGVYYSATYMEAQLCDSEEVIVVGGGNSAGQAALFLARTSSKVHLLVRSDRLSESMSQYLVQRIEQNSRIEICFKTEVIGLHGGLHLESAEWRDDIHQTRVKLPIRHVFVMTGAVPRTEWLQDSIILDKKGFVVTGPDLEEYKSEFEWPLQRTPLLLETSIPGVFAVGDSRSGSVKRVASAVGEGAMAVHLVHRFLASETSGNFLPDSQVVVAGTR